MCPQMASSNRVLFVWLLILRASDARSSARQRCETAQNVTPDDGYTHAYHCIGHVEMDSDDPAVIYMDPDHMSANCYNRTTILHLNADVSPTDAAKNSSATRPCAYMSVLVGHDFSAAQLHNDTFICNLEDKTKRHEVTMTFTRKAAGCENFNLTLDARLDELDLKQRQMSMIIKNGITKAAIFDVTEEMAKGDLSFKITSNAGKASNFVTAYVFAQSNAKCIQNNSDKSAYCKSLRDIEECIQVDSIDDPDDFKARRNTSVFTLQATVSSTARLTLTSKSVLQPSTDKWFVLLRPSVTFTTDPIKYDVALEVLHTSSWPLSLSILVMFLLPLLILVFFASVTSAMTIYRRSNTAADGWFLKMFRDSLQICRDSIREPFNGFWLGLCKWEWKVRENLVGYPGLVLLAGGSFFTAGLQMSVGLWGKMMVSGNQDTCFYNFECYHSWGMLDMPLNNMVSHIPYIVAGLWTVYMVALAEVKLEKATYPFKFNGNDGKVVDCNPDGDVRITKLPAESQGIRRGDKIVSVKMRTRDGELSVKLEDAERSGSDYTVEVQLRSGWKPDLRAFYGLGFAVLLETFGSICYHICPTKYEFQFDASMMYMITVLVMIAIVDADNLEDPPEIADNTRRNRSSGPVANCPCWLRCLACFLGDASEDQTSPFLQESEDAVRMETRNATQLNMMLIIALPMWVISAIGTWFDFLVPRETPKTYWVYIGVVVAWYVLVAYRAHGRIFPTGDGRRYSGTCCFLFGACLILIIITLSPQMQRAGLGGMSNIFLYFSVLVMLVVSGREIYRGGADNLEIKHPMWWCSKFVWLLFVLVSGVALWLFSNKIANVIETPAESRTHNSPCIWGPFDRHDLWHMLSAIALAMLIYIILDLQKAKWERAKLERRKKARRSGSAQELTIPLEQRSVEPQPSTPAPNIRPRIPSPSSSITNSPRPSPTQPVDPHLTTPVVDLRRLLPPSQQPRPQPQPQRLVHFNPQEGFLADGNDCTGYEGWKSMSIEDAKRTALALKGCVGFTFAHERPDKIRFKSSWKFIRDPRWTSYEALNFNVGDDVEVEVTKGTWRRANVTTVHCEDGTYSVEVHDLAKTKIRPQIASIRRINEALAQQATAPLMRR